MRSFSKALPAEGERQFSTLRFLTSKPSIYFTLVVIALTTTRMSWAQETNLPWCGLEQLNLDIGPQSDSPSSRGHWLVVEIQNRSESDCKLPPFSVGFPPNGPDITDIFEKAFYKDTSTSAAEFKERSHRLGPGGEAHVLLAWSSVPIEYNGIVLGGCSMHDTMTLYSDPQHIALDVQHLWIQSCDQIWGSSYRAGPYVLGEPISDEWLRRVQLKDSDFTNNSVADLAPLGADASLGSRLRSLFDVQYLRGSPGSGYYSAFPLFFETSPEASGVCPFRSLRKREADGQTTIYMSHCQTKVEPVGNSTRAKQVGFFDVDFGLAPERTGRVEYEAVSNVQQNSKPMLAKAKLELFIRDPNRPMLPTIDTSTPNCRIAQLRLISPELKLGSHWDQAMIYPPRGEDWYDGKVFEVTNISDQSCMIGGLPEMKFQRPSSWTSGSIDPPVCRNCATPLFKPRESRWIELKPGSSAHFMVARAASAYWPACTATGGIDLKVAGDTQTLSLPFEASFCGELAVTAWRSGKYDGDPMNVEYERKENEREKEWQSRTPLSRSKVACVDNTKPQSQLPPSGPQCAEQEFAKRGRPSLFTGHDGVAFGISSPKKDSTTIYLWMDNQTNEPRFYSSCPSDLFAAIDVYDSLGHRLLSKQEQADRKVCAEKRVLLSGCSGSWSVTVAPVVPHTMQVVDSGDLKDGYVLSPGRFFVAASQVQRQTCETLNTTLAGGSNTRPTNAVMIVIPQQ